MMVINNGRYMLGDIRNLQADLKPSETNNGDRKFYIMVGMLFTDGSSTFRSGSRYSHDRHCNEGC
jgi:hypothetical protein